MGNQKNIVSVMAKLENKSKDNPRLEQRLLADGQISLYLEYYLGRRSEPVLDEAGDPVLYDSGKMKGKPKFKVSHIRRKENLNLYLVANPRTPLDRQQNKETLELAKKIRFERGQQLLEDMEGYRLKKDREVNFLEFFQKYNDSYTKKDYRMMPLTLNRFKDFLKETDEYRKYETFIKPDQITKEMMEDFVIYLQGRSKGEGALNIFTKFKKVCKYAVENDVMRKNPCEGVRCTADKNVLRKDILSMDEVQRLADTHYTYENPEIRRAFLFCCYAGLRYCDVKDLTFESVDYSNKRLSFEQSKTKGHSASSGVEIPLSDGLIRLIGKPVEGNKKAKIFNLPTFQACNKALARWVKRAGIDKHITWHCARHSCATNLLSNGSNIKTVASILGHSGLRHTEKYTRAVDSLKKAAIDSLPELKI